MEIDDIPVSCRLGWSPADLELISVLSCVPECVCFEYFIIVLVASKCNVTTPLSVRVHNLQHIVQRWQRRTPHDSQLSLDATHLCKEPGPFISPQRPSSSSCKEEQGESSRSGAATTCLLCSDITQRPSKPSYRP